MPEDGKMRLSLEQVRKAFQDSMPSRQREFARKLNAAKDKLTKTDSLYQRTYPIEVLRLAEEEFIARILLARSGVQQLIDSGWIPIPPESLSSAFVAMFSNYRTITHDPKSDLYDKVQSCFNEVGVDAPAAASKALLNLTQAQTEAAEASLSYLDVYATQRWPEKPSKNIRESELADAARDVTYSYDVFICHASDDKMSFVNELVHGLQNEGLRVWVDSLRLKVGDQLRDQIDQGLASSRYGIAVLSKAWFSKPWPKDELEGLMNRQNATGRKVVLPVWFDVDKDFVALHSPSLVGRVAARYDGNMSGLIDQLLDAMDIDTEEAMLPGIPTLTKKDPSESEPGAGQHKYFTSETGMSRVLDDSAFSASGSLQMAEQTSGPPVAFWDAEWSCGCYGERTEPGDRIAFLPCAAHSVLARSMGLLPISG